MRPQVEQELSIITAVGYEEYFLVVWNILQDCRAHGIEWITRGSAADSLVCYCLGISDVCPVRFGLYFRRFLNQERMALNKLPDIDMDFPHDRKDDVVDLIFAKYGREHCAVVGGFSTFQARSAVCRRGEGAGRGRTRSAPVHRTFSVELRRRLGAGRTYARAAGRSCANCSRPARKTATCRWTKSRSRPRSTMAEFLDGFPRNPKMHPCGVVLSRQPMHELTPTFISNKGYPTTHFDMDAVEVIGLVKIDVLAQGGLAVMRDAKAALARRGVAVDLNALEPWQDPQVWEMISGGGARAVHHIESPAMTGLCRQCNVRDIDTLIAIVSVIRPGAANEGKKLAFTRRYQGLEPVTYPHPSLEPVLRDTFGLVVYEEHILQICEAFAGLPPGRADVLRRALNKQKRAVIAEIREEFFAVGAGARTRAGEDRGSVGAGRRLRRLRLLQGPFHRLRRRGVSSGVAQAQLSGGIHGGGVDQRQGILRSAGLCAGMPPARIEIPAADGQRAGTAVRGAGQRRIRVPLTRAKGLTGRTDANGCWPSASAARSFRWRTFIGRVQTVAGRNGDADPRGRL